MSFKLIYVTKNHKDPEEFITKIYDKRTKVDKMCEEFYDSVICAQNRTAILAKISESDSNYNNPYDAMYQLFVEKLELDGKDDYRDEALKILFKKFLSGVKELDNEDIEQTINNMKDHEELVINQIEALVELSEPTNRYEKINIIGGVEQLQRKIRINLGISKDHREPHPCAIILCKIYGV